MKSQPSSASVPHDNLFGVCHALGETFGFNPIYLRVALLIVVMLNAEAALIAYFAIGIAVTVAKLATRSGNGRPRTNKPVRA